MGTVAFAVHGEGTSVIGVQGLLVERATFSNTNGTAPAAGVDIEPNLASQRLTNVTFADCRSSGNANAGFAMYSGRVLMHVNQLCKRQETNEHPGPVF